MKHGTSIAKVGDLCEQIRGVSYAKADASSEPGVGRVPILRANNITDSGLTYDDLVYVPESRVSPKQKLRKHDILVAASSGSLSVVGKTAQCPQDFECGFGAFCKVLRPNEKVHVGFFAHYFQTPRYRHTISNLAAGANINNLKNEHLNDLEIPLPPLPEQRRIAAILDKADAIRRKRRESLKLLDDFLRSLFIDMFGDPATNPKGWPCPPLGSAFASDRGGTKCGPFGSALKRNEYVGEGIPVWTMDSIQGDRFSEDVSLFITDTKYAELQAYSVRDGDIIISRAGTVGKMCVVRTSIPDSVISTNLIRLSLDETKGSLINNLT